LFDKLTSAGSIDDSEFVDARRSILYEAEIDKKKDVELLLFIFLCLFGFKF
jgi:hypothetical protein